MEADQQDNQEYLQNQPEFEISSALSNSQEIHNLYASCILKDLPEKDPEFKISTRKLSTNIKIQSKPNHAFTIENLSPIKKHSISFKKKYAIDPSISPKKGECLVGVCKTIENGSTIPHRTLFSSSKNQMKHMQYHLRGNTNTAFKTQRQSQSPDRKALYWQSWMLKKIDSQPSNCSLNNMVEPSPEITSESYCAMLADTHETLIFSNKHEKREIASLTKIMTAYTVVNICSDYGIKIREHSIIIHQTASYMEGTSANLKSDEEILIIDLLYGLLLPSGNDAGVALAHYFGKFLSFKHAKDNSTNHPSTSIHKFKQFQEFYDKEFHQDSIKLFVFQMNKNSHKIGLKNTHFVNPTGLSNSKNLSTAKDVALLTSHCLKNHILRDIFKRKYYDCEVKNQKMAYVRYEIHYCREVQWKNTNRHLFQIKECIGAKTGITPTAGPCLSSVYKILGREIIVVVLNCKSVEDRYQDAYKIYKWCRRNIRIY